MSNLSAVQSVFQSVKKIYQTFKTKGGVIDELKCAKKRIIGREGHPLPRSSMIANVSVLRSSVTFNIFNLLPRSSITMRTMLGGWLAAITSGVKRRRRGRKGVVFHILQLALIKLFTNFDHEK